MASELKTADREQNIQLLQARNSRLAEQVATLKEEKAALEDSVQQYEKGQKHYADTLLCVNRIWTQFSSDIATLATRNAQAAGPTPATDASAAAAAAPDAAAAAAAGGGPDGGAAAGDSAEQPELVWDSYDPFLARLLQSDAASSSRALKKHSQAYLSHLSATEEVLHARAAAGLQALAKLLDVIEARNEAAAQQQQQLRQLSSDAALKAANEQLQEQLGELQEQLTAATALQRATQALLKQAEDRAFHAEEALTTARNDLADKDAAYAAAQRKLQRLQQQQAQQQQQQQQQQPDASAGGSNGGAGPAAAAAAAGGAAAGAEGESEAAAAAIKEREAQVSQLQELLEQRSAERDEQVEAVAQLHRELDELRSRQQDESWVTHSSLYKLVQQQLSEAHTQIEARSRQLATLQHEKDELLRHFDNKTQAVEVERVLRNQVLHLQQQVNELNIKQVDLLAQKQALQMAHREELSAYGHLKTTAELQSMLAALQKEVDTNAGHARKAAEASGAADTARQEALTLRSQLTAAQSTIKALQARLQSKASELQGVSGREEELKERLNDLNAFVEVLTTVVADTRDLLELRRSEAALKAQLADTQAKLQGDALQQQVAAAAATEASLRKQLEAAAAEAANLQGQVHGLQQQVSALQEEVKNKQLESEAFANEIGDALGAFEQQRQQNSTLLQQLVERDAALTALKGEKLAVQQQLEALNDKLSGVQLRVSTLEGELKAAKSLQEATDKDLTRTSSELAAARDQVVSANSSLESVKAELKAVHDSKAQLQVLYDQEKADHASRKQAADKAASELRQEAAKRQRLEDTNKQLSARLDRMHKTVEKSEEVRLLEQEIGLLHNKLVCSVCHSRDKNVIITKCFHMFCGECLYQAHQARNRQCPSCGRKYQQTDVQEFFFT